MLKPVLEIALVLMACVQAEMEGYIVGGLIANLEKHPHSALLIVNCNKKTWICGASILNQQILLTAGHCLYTCTIDEHIGVYVGSESNGWGIIYSVKNFMVHEQYNQYTSNGDLCLVKLTSALVLNKKSSRVAMMKHPPYDEPARVAGWGLIDEINEIKAVRLKWLMQKIIPNEVCKEKVGILLKGTFCAAAENEGKYVSHGDSGSALVVRSYIQIGIVSFKVPFMTRNVVVYTDVGYYHDWIKKYSEKLYCSKNV